MGGYTPAVHVMYLNTLSPCLRSDTSASGVSLLAESSQGLINDQLPKKAMAGLDSDFVQGGLTSIMCLYQYNAQP